MLVMKGNIKMVRLNRINRSSLNEIDVDFSEVVARRRYLYQYPEL